MAHQGDNDIIYMDYAATAPMKPEVVDAMLPWMQHRYGNPSSVHRLGRQARHALDEAREIVAAAIGARPAEIVFTSSGTEADNLAVKGAFRAVRQQSPGRNRIVTSTIEHHAVLHSVRFWENQGFPVTYVRVDRGGVVAAEAVAEALGGDTALVSLMHANNEVGTVQPVAEVGRLCQEAGALFHVDAVQSFGKIPVNVDDIGCDLLALSAHKIGGPKGVGCLYVRTGTPLVPHTDGGAQERGMRAGTENVAGIVGFAAAVKAAMESREDEAARLSALGDRLADMIVQRIPGVTRSGTPHHRVPGIVHLVIEGVDAESLLLNLDLQGVAAASGSACTSGSLEPSHVLLAMGLSKEAAAGALRLSLGWASNENELEPVAERLAAIVERLRKRRASTHFGKGGVPWT